MLALTVCTGRTSGWYKQISTGPDFSTCRPDASQKQLEGSRWVLMPVRKGHREDADRVVLERLARFGTACCHPADPVAREHVDDAVCAPHRSNTSTRQRQTSFTCYAVTASKTIDIDASAVFIKQKDAMRMLADAVFSD
eukprot:3590860-Rhodomonas_salina.2